MKKDMTSFKWANDNNPISLTQEYILPPENRPNLTKISSSSNSISIRIPIIDMKNNNEELLVHEIAKACEDFGFFVVINHGIPQELCNNVLDVITKFFNLSHEIKTQFFSSYMDDGKIVRHRFIDQTSEKEAAMWSEAFFHTWHPVDVGFIQKLPHYPSHFRETIASYAKEIGPLIDKLLGLISKGLGLSKDYLQRRLAEYPEYTAQANYYPSCPSPELTLGLQPHTDIKVLGIVLQDQGITGLHFFKDQQWIAIDPIPASLVVNVAEQLQVLSNDKYTSAFHRAVNNNVKERVSYATFYGLNKDSMIGPIPELTNQHHPPLHPNYTFDQFCHYRVQKKKPLIMKQRSFRNKIMTSSPSFTSFSHLTNSTNSKMKVNYRKKGYKILRPFHNVHKLSFSLSYIF